ncbi:AraC family transcriptional regulator [Rhizobiaceae bacterium BDR2-2]|uniref:AraC family transcriptional regulator n=1 Tax=Ectorhizobium quercum TaxID=2965071 RepID=A0AAE3SUR5_9HYPH|nr:AraC family transcriptional regulator [Ectorhizobium quercum]MCX8996983.1 AraC family transcriptional regulator [Ectorhizobium quercum]
MDHRQQTGSAQIPGPVSEVSVLPITQATAATFTDLFIGLTFLCFIRSGTKRVICPVNGEMIGEEGDLLVFPPGSMVTLENRPLPNASYRADGVYFSHDLVDTVFADQPTRNDLTGIQVLRAPRHRPSEILDLIRDTLDNEALPPPIRQHRLLEPLIWLRHNGVRLPTRDEEQPLGRVRRLVETDISHPWRIPEVAGHFAMSEATFRRWLAKSGHAFSKILLNTRLEKGLALLQTTDIPISRIALECGFKTPSHFSDSFRKRFGIKPKGIRSAAD